MERPSREPGVNDRQGAERGATQLLMRRPHLRNLPGLSPLPDGYDLRRGHGDDDVDGIASVLTAAFDDRWPADRVRRTLTDAGDVKAVYVVAWQGQPVATASSRWVPHRFPASGVVHWIGTHPAHAHKGLGSALMGRLLDDFRERGYREAVLETDDFRLPAIRTYLKFGFVPVSDAFGEDHRDRWSAIFQRLPARST